jgi:glycosyltransferase involved in cell wall biosynthesis
VRILILAYYFPPLNSTASHRPYSWAAAWLKAGHEIHVLTTEKYAFDGALDLDYDLGGIHVHSAAYLKVAAQTASHGENSREAAQRWDRLKLLTRRLRLGAGMFGEIAWLAYRPLLERGLDLARRYRFDFVISTSPPEVMHFVARAISRRSGVPWIADYRDLWFPEMRVNQLRVSSWLTGVIKRPRLREAVAVSTISEGLAQRLRDFLGREVIVCYNGYMPDLPVSVLPRPWRDSKRHVVHTGRMFPGKRDPQPFFQGLVLALREDPSLGERVAVDLYGFADGWIRDAVGAYGLNGVVSMHGLVSHRESLTAQRHADRLLFLDWMDRRAEGVLSGKLFEYLASGRPIMCVGGRKDSEAARIIADASAGETLCAPEEICDRILALARPGSAPVPPMARPGIERYSRFTQAEGLLEHIASRLAVRAAA